MHLAPLSLLALATATLTIAAPASNLEQRQCFSGPFQGGGCNVYKTEILTGDGNPDCADICIAEGVRRGCCGATSL